MTFHWGINYTGKYTGSHTYHSCLAQDFREAYMKALQIIGDQEVNLLSITRIGAIVEPKDSLAFFDGNLDKVNEARRLLGQAEIKPNWMGRLFGKLFGLI